MKPLFIVAVLLLLPAAASQTTSGNFLHVQSYPEYQYSTDEDVRVEFKATFYRSNTPQDVQVIVDILHANRTPVDLPGGQERFQDGVRPHPATNEINFGQLDAGLYEIILQAKAGGLTKLHKFSFAVTPPPVEFEGTLQGHRDDSATYKLKSDGGTFRVVVFSLSDGAKRVHSERVVEGNASIKIPYVKGQPVFIHVIDEHDWVTEEPAWYPDFADTQNYKRVQPWNALIAGGLLLATIVASVAFIRTKARRQT